MTFGLVECKSWVWKATHKSCYLKTQYDESKTEPCSDCVAQSQGGKYYFVSKYSSTMGGSSGDVSAGSGDVSAGSSRVQEKDLSWATESGIWMPKSIAAKTCTISKGYDQPAKYNIHSQPLEVQFGFQCCNECAKLNGKRLSASENVHDRMLYLQIASPGSSSWIHRSAI